jgi:TonB family protein
LLCAIAVATAPFAFAQGKENKDNQDLSELRFRPIYVTARVFQMKARRGSYQEVSDQVFKMKTASLTEYEMWLNAFKKTYPGFDIALLRTESKRVFRTPKPAVISLGKQPDGRDIEVLLYGAQSVGDGVKPGTSLVAEIGLHFGSRASKPVTYAIQPLEVESGMTYFFSATNLKLGSTDYVKFVRSNAPAEPFDGDDIFLIFAFSVDLDKTTQPARYFDEKQSVELQRQATKKVQPEVSAALREAGLGGFIRVRIVISAEGKAPSANIHSSTFPEMNSAAISAARQWEFPTALFAENKNPITGFLTFSFAASTPKAATQNSAKQ